MLTRADSGLARIVHGTADWGDADGDGDFDLVVAGNLIRPDETGETVVRVLFKEAGGWTPVDVIHEFNSPDEPWLDFEGVTWADYDSDGDVDLLVTGQWLGDGEIFGRAEVYANNGGTFTLAGAPLPAPNFGNTGGAFTWFDLDSDGDLDYFVAGAYYVPGGNGLLESRVQIFRNDAVATNAAPSLVSALQAIPAGDDVTLSWGQATDATTPIASLTYDVTVSPVGAGGFSMLGTVATPPPLPQPGNVSRNTTWSVHGLAPGTYAWTVRALDNAFTGGPVSGGTFVIGGTTGVEAESGPTLSLASIGPNPGPGQARVALVLPNAGVTRVEVFDVRGRRVATLHEGRLAPGRHEFTTGRTLGAGLYFVRATTSAGTVQKRITLLN